MASYLSLQPPEFIHKLLTRLDVFFSKDPDAENRKRTHHDDNIEMSPRSDSDLPPSKRFSPKKPGTAQGFHKSKPIFLTNLQQTIGDLRTNKSVNIQTISSLFETFNRFMDGSGEQKLMATPLNNLKRAKSAEVVQREVASMQSILSHAKIKAGQTFDGASARHSQEYFSNFVYLFLPLLRTQHINFPERQPLAEITLQQR